MKKLMCEGYLHVCQKVFNVYMYFGLIIPSVNFNIYSIAFVQQTLDNSLNYPNNHYQS